MFQVVYENRESWPDQGPLLVKAPPVAIEIAVSPTSARQRANGYLVTDVSMTLHATNPMLLLDERPVWRLSLAMRLRGLDQVATLGTLDVDAQTREVLPLTSQQIRAIRDQANAIVTSLAPETTPAI